MNTRFDFAQQANRCAEALARHRRMGNEHGQASDLITLGNLACNQADFAAALDYLHEAEDIAQRLGDEGLARKAVGQTAGVLMELGDFEAAIASSRRVLKMPAAGAAPESFMIALNTMSTPAVCPTALRA